MKADTFSSCHPALMVLTNAHREQGFFSRELGSLQRRVSWQRIGPFSKEQGKRNQQGAVTAGSMMDCSLMTFR